MNFEEGIVKAREMIEKSKNPIVFFDKDSDGSMSFIQLRKSFPQIKAGFPLGKEDESQFEARDLIFDDTDLVIFFDTPYVKGEVFEAIGDKEVLWVDHHKKYNEKILENYKQVFYLNPLDYDSNDSRCSAYMAYLICNKEENLKYCVLGSVGDFYLLDVIPKLYEVDKEAFNSLFKIDDKTRKELFKFIKDYSFLDNSVYDERRDWIQRLWYDCDFILFKFFFDVMYKLDDARIAMRALRKIEKMSLAEFRIELNEGRTGMFEKFSEISNEYKKVYAKIAKKTKDNNIVHLEHDNTLISYNRQLSEEFAYRLKDTDVIFSSYHKDERDIVSGSIRSRKSDVAALIEMALEGLEGQGGGHVNSAGFIVKKKDFETFKNRIFSKFN